MAKTSLVTKIVTRNDTAENWSTKNPVLLKGEMGIEIDTQKIKIGDGVATWSALTYANVTAAELAEALAGVDVSTEAYTGVKTNLEDSDTSIIEKYITDNSVEPHEGDVFVVNTVVEGVTYETSGYVYDGAQWVAMTGSVDADKVIMRENITLAGDYTKVGNLSKTSTGTATLEAKGKSVQDVLMEILSKRLQPGTPGAPSVTTAFKMSVSGAVEAGTKYDSLGWSGATFNAGSYTYGPTPTGAAVDSWKIDRICVPTTMSKESVGSAVSGTDTNGDAGFIIGDQGGDNVVSSIKFKATATYSQGDVALDNLGDPSSPEVRIAAGSKSRESAALTPFRKSFYGTSTDITTPVNSAWIRENLSAYSDANGNAIAAANGSKFTLNIPEGTKRIVIAYPATLQDLSSVIYVEGMNSELVGTAIQKDSYQSINVEGANGYAAISYKVYIIEVAGGLTARTYNVTI